MAKLQAIYNRIFFFTRIGLIFIPITACTGAEVGLLMGAGTIATVINEDKLPVDYIAEAKTGLDCNSIRRLNDKGPLCREPESIRYVDPPIYCYRTIGRTECFDHENPYQNDAQPIQ